MSSAIRTLHKHARSLSQTVKVPGPRQPVRAIHSAFVVLNTPTTVVSSGATTVNWHSTMYEKQSDHLPDPTISHSGTRSYVVSQPDPADTPYTVPSGAYPTSSPYVNYTSTEAPNAEKAQMSSTAPGFAHPMTTRATAQNVSGVGESAAVRHATAPGELGARGGSYGGLGLMDKGSTTPGEGELAARNPQPDSAVAEKFSKAGVDNAWKGRK